MGKTTLSGRAYTANEMAKARCNKLQPRETGIFCIIKVQQHTVELDKKGVLITVLIQKITVVLELREHCPKTAQTRNSATPETLITQQKIRKEFRECLLSSDVTVGHCCRPHRRTWSLSPEQTLHCQMIRVWTWIWDDRASGEYLAANHQAMLNTFKPKTC